MITNIYHDSWHLFLCLLLGHIIGDFILQNEKLLKKKEQGVQGILLHVLILFGVSIVLIIPYIFMLADFANTPIVLSGLLSIYIIHFFVDKKKIQFTKKYPQHGFKYYILDQIIHVLTLAIVVYFLSPYISISFGNDILGDFYFANEFWLYAIFLILATFTWEITKHVRKVYDGKKRKKVKYNPDVKFMMIRGIIVSLVFLLVTPYTVHAANYDTTHDVYINSVEPSTFSFGDTVSIIGQGFGERDDYSQICWSDYCLHDDNIILWEENKITFEFNVIGMPVTGLLEVVKLHSSGLFVETTKADQISIKPTITAFYDLQGNQLFSLTSGQDVVMKGYYFGTNKDLIKFDNITVTDITSWADDQIIFKVPQLSKSTNTVLISRNNVDYINNIKGNIGMSDDIYGYMQSYLFDTNTDKAWEKYSTRGEDVVIAVIDDGVDINHEDLRDSIYINTAEIPYDGIDNDGNGYIDDYNGYDFLYQTSDMTPNGEHGTLVAGVIAAQSNNKIGITGISPKVTIMPLIVCGVETCKGDSIYEAVIYAVDNGADILNMSLTGYGAVPVFDKNYDEMMKYAYDHDVLVVVSSGNGDSEMAKAKEYYGRNFNVTPSSPVCNDGDNNWVIGVSSINSKLSNSTFADYGSNCIDISAFGENIFSSGVPIFSNGDSYIYVDGTSFAAPQVSGALALALSAYPEKDVNLIKEILINSGHNLDVNLSAEFKGHFGKGLNILAFLDAVDTYKGDSVIPTGDNSEYEDLSTELNVANNIDNEIMQTGEFSDLDSKNRSYLAIKYLSENGVFSGYEDGTFKPTKVLNRAELLKILVESTGITPNQYRYRNCFDDVSEEWFAPYVCYAKKEGWIEGYKDGTFKPDQDISKVEALKMLLEIFEVELINEELSYIDVDQNEWYYNYISTAYSLNLLEEKGVLFNPAKGRTRSSIAENIFRLTFVQILDLDQYDKDLVESFLAADVMLD